VQFDNNNDGLGRGTGDDQITVGGGGSFSDAFYTSTGPGLGGLGVSSDSGAGGTTDGLGAASNAAGFSYFEIKHPLNSADDAHDYSLNIGSHVGFFVVYQDAEGSASGYNRYWPSFQPSAMAEYTVADLITPTITLSFTPGTVDIGTGPPGTGTVTAALKDAASHPVPGKVVTLSYGPTAGGPWTMFASGGTNSLGEYAATFNPPTTGTYYFMAEVTADANINAGSGTSAPNAMTVIPELPPPLVLLTLALLLVATITATRRRQRASIPSSSA
jgi:hypothetical protein